MSGGRCPWCGDHADYVRYHDEEWGVPVRDDRLLFEMLTLEGAQAGLSWLTVLRKREGYRRVFHHFDVERVAAFSEADCALALQDSGIVRNRLKVHSTVANARAILQLRGEGVSLADFLWDFVDGRPIQNAPASMEDLVSRTPVSDAMSKGLRRRGFKFVGTTICHAFMQAVGMVNDHLVSCPRREALKR